MAPSRGRSVGAYLSALFSARRHDCHPATADKAHRCPLCGREFSSAEAAACPTCPIAERCGLVMCPACGYEFPPS